LLGDEYVAVLPTRNQGEIFSDGDVATAQAPFDLQEAARDVAGLIMHIDQTASNLNGSIDDVRRLVLNEQTLTNISSMAQNFRMASQRALVTLDRVNTVLDTNTPTAA